MITRKEQTGEAEAAMSGEGGTQLAAVRGRCSSFATAGPVVFEALRRVYRPDTDEASWVPAKV